MSKYDDFEDDYRDELKDLDSEDSEVEEEDGFLTFKSFLLSQRGLLDDKNKKLLKKNTSHIYVLWDIYKDDYIDYCEENGYENEILEEE